MGLISVMAAAAAAWLFGALWYGIVSQAWIAASGVALDDRGKPANASNPLPYIVSLASVVLAAGMMRHVFALSGIDTLTEGAVAGGGLGLFLATPWLATCYGFAGRPAMLTVIDGTYATLGCTLMGLALTLF